MLLIAGTAPAVAAAAPELLNKTIQVSFTLSTPVRRDNGQAFVGVINLMGTIYISSAGRAFARTVAMSGSHLNRNTLERAPGENTVQLQGRRLIAHFKLNSGALQTAIEVAPSASSCTAAVIVGREGRHSLRWKGVTGMMASAEGPMTVSNVACSVSTGNGVAQ
jgi:hypothetical protein